MAETMKDFEKELEESYKILEGKQELAADMSEDEIQVWEELKQLQEEKTEIDVKITEVVKGGAVAFVNETRGFIPASKLSLSYVEDLNTFMGEHLKVRVFDVDAENKKLILSAKEILREKEEAEKKEKMDSVKTGSILEGVVDSIQPYGAFVKLDNGLSGLVHISQIAQKRIKTPGEVLSVGEKVKVKVIGIKEGKISLSIKALSDTMEETVTEDFEIPKTEDVTTSLGSLFKNIKLD